MSGNEAIKIGIVAGEHSGDRLGAGIIRALKSSVNVELYGVGGPELSAEGLNSEFNFKKLQVMGLIEPLMNYRELSNLRKDLIKLFLENEIDYFIGVDSPDFNMAIHKKMKIKNSAKNIQLVSPSVWVWRQGRIKSIQKYIDLTICLFSFEHDFFQKRNLHSIHLGHPFATLKKIDKDEVIKSFNLDKDKKYISILPGSRRSELKNMLPTFINFMQIHSKKYPDYNYLIPAADSQSKEFIEDSIPDDIPFSIGVNCSKEFLSISDFSVVTSGTATLEAAVLGCSPIICYKTNAINYSIISRMLKVKHVGLPNLLLNSRIYPELIQKDCSADSILIEAETMQNNRADNDHERRIRDLLSGIGFEEAAYKITSL